MANSSTLFEHLSIPAPALWGGILFYIAVVLAIGIFAGRKIRNMSDFIVAGRRLTLLPAIGTLLATWFGAGSCIGIAASVYRGFPAVFSKQF